MYYTILLYQQVHQPIAKPSEACCRAAEGVKAYTCSVKPFIAETCHQLLERYFMQDFPQAAY